MLCKYPIYIYDIWAGMNCYNLQGVLGSKPMIQWNYWTQTGFDLFFLFHAIYYCLLHLKYFISSFIYHIIYFIVFDNYIFFTYDFIIHCISNVCFLVTSCTEKTLGGPLRWRQNWIMRCSVLWRCAMVWVLGIYPFEKTGDDLSGIIELPILGGIKPCKCPVFFRDFSGIIVQCLVW